MTYFPIEDKDVVNKKSKVRQLVDVLQVDIASLDSEDTPQNTRRKYDVFVTGGLDVPGVVTSSLFHTVYDQDYSLQTSNEVLDITVGLFEKGTTALYPSPTTDASGKLVYPNTTLMMREKINIYKQYAQLLLGDANGYFSSPFSTTSDFSADYVSITDHSASPIIEDALFINMKRLFMRDGLEKEQFSFKIKNTTGGELVLYSDSGASASLTVSTVCGSVGTIVDGSNNAVGLIFYDKGIVVLNARKVFNATEDVTETIHAVTGSDITGEVNTLSFTGDLIPDFFVSGSIDDILDHICEDRFGRGNSSAFGFMNNTSINSTIYFCRVGPNDANFSSNPTYTDDDGTIRCIQEKGDDPFAYITTVGLYDASGEMIAVAKTSRPIEKNPEVDLSISVRIDY